MASLRFAALAAAVALGGGAHISSSVPADRAPRVRTVLRRLHVLFTQRPSAFVLVTGS